MYISYRQQFDVCDAPSRKNEMSLNLVGKTEENCSILDTVTFCVETAFYNGLLKER